MGGILLALIFQPLVAAALVLAAGSRRNAIARQVALVSTIVSGAILWEVANEMKVRSPEPFSRGGVVQPQFELSFNWLDFHTKGDDAEGGLKFHFGVDGVSLCMLFLTVVLSFVAVFAAWNTIRSKVAEFHALLLALQSGLLGAFCAFDLILFYVFFEFTLIPIFFMIDVWGGAKRQWAARKFFFYTLTGSLLSLVGLVGLAISVHQFSNEPLTFSIPELAQQTQRLMLTAEGKPSGAATSAVLTSAAQLEFKQSLYNAQFWIFLAIFAGFAVKVPLVPFHTWLPPAYGEAPTVATMLMAGVLSKLGCYGFLRVCVPLLPYASWNVGMPLVGALAVVGILYGALCALAQTDVKRLVAYSSVSHLGFIMLGVFALNAEGLAGATIQMVNHGVVTGGLFLLVGALSDRYRTRNLTEVGGLSSRLPAFTLIMFFFCLASAGLPGLAGFVGEFLSLYGIFARRPLLGILGALGIVLGAWYLMTLLKNLFFGPLREPESDGEPVRDLRPMELAAIFPLGVLVLALGVYPAPLLDRIKADVNDMAAVYQQPEQLKPPAPVRSR